VWRELAERYSGRHVLVIAHGGTIRIILAHVLGIPSSRLFALEVPYAGLSRVRVTTDYAQLVFHNRRSAL
jgi:alpha-ribazole phosphatase/probable phosphoglycerate mutase